MDSKYESAMNMAINGAEQFHGATSPLPPAGAIALDKRGKVLLGASRQNASGPSAEAKLLDLAQKLGKLTQIETLVCTLAPEPESILKHKSIRRVVVGFTEERSLISAEERSLISAEERSLIRLKAAGLQIITGVMAEECAFLVRAYAKFSRTGQPYVTLFSAGEKNLGSSSSAMFLHELRKRADAIWTGSGTVLAHQPDFSVKLTPDHPQKRRILVLSDRRRRISPDWLKKAVESGFAKTHFADTLQSGLDFLASQKVQEVLVEAGPELRNAWLESKLWDESVVILQGDGEDDIDIQFRQEAGEN